MNDQQMPEPGSAFGRALLQHRKATGLSQAMLAQASGLSVRALRDLERGRSGAPQERSTELLADAFGLCGEERLSFTRLAKQLRRRFTHDGGSATLSSLPAVQHLVGRETELQWLLQKADHGGVVVIAGLPGVGKTALAASAAKQLASRFPDGCLALDLRGADDRPLPAGLALERVLTGLGVSASRLPATEDERGALFRMMLQQRRVLLVLDNAVDEAHVRPLLVTSSHSMTIVTCRRMLSGLESARWLPLDVLSATNAVDLVVSIVGADAVRKEAEAVQELVALCDNLPLAVKIVGNRLATRRRWSIAQAVQQLQDERLRLDSLAEGDLHLRAAFELSYRRLPADVQSVFRRLAVIPGAHFDEELASVATGEPLNRIGVVLDLLVEMSLLTITTAPLRFQFHDLLRIFARERYAAEEPEHVRHQLRDRLHSHVIGLVKAGGALFFSEARTVPENSPFGSQQEASDWIDREASTWTAVQREAAELGRHRDVCEMAWSMHRYTVGRELRHRWFEICELGLLASRKLGDPRTVAGMLSLTGWLQYKSADDGEGALVTLAESAEFGSRLDDIKIISSAHATAGMVLAGLGRHEEGIEQARLGHLMAAGQDFFQFRLWRSLALGTTLLVSGRLEEAQAVHEQLLAETDSRCDESNRDMVTKVRVMLLMFIGDSLAGLGRWEEAAETYHSARAQERVDQSGYRSESELALNEGVAWREAGDLEQARTCLVFARDRLTALADPLERERVEAELALLAG